jgi:sortase (surface protein transpeptidase)
MNSVKKSSKRRLVKNRSPLASVKGRSGRVRKYALTLPLAYGLIISLRKFTTDKKRRSKQKRQLVVNLNISHIREVAFELTGPKKKKSGRSPDWSSVFKQVPFKTAAASALIFVGIISSLFFGTHLQKPVDFTIRPSSVKVLAEPHITGKVLPKSTPTRLQIPKIGVNTQLSQVGLQANGQMQMPWDIETASWYRYSPTPGELGPSVIVGHLDGANYANMAGVFYRLHELVPGDRIMVTRDDGSVAAFKVLYLKQVPQNNFPTREIYGNINYAGLRLITCGGTFDSSTGHYNQNTVVYAALE